MARQTNTLKQAKETVKNYFGSELAKKATDAFCLTYGSSAGRRSAFAESAPVNANPPVLLEFGKPKEKATPKNVSSEVFRESDVWSQLSLAVEAFSSSEKELELRASIIVRNARIQAAREKFYLVAAPLVNDVEKASRAFPPSIEARARSRNAAGVTEICWLNRTVRSIAHPGILADIAGDSRIDKIDLGRRLEPEIRVSSVTVGAPTYRTTHSVTGKGTIVAVIDSEVALDHPALKGRVIHKQNYTNESWGVNGTHATAVAGIIGANSKTISGMAPDVTIYNYKVIAEDNALSSDDFGGALAIQQALEDGVHIANCSWGAGPAGDGTSREALACDEAWNLGMTIVKSAGNRGPGARTLTTPADAEGVIVVGATDHPGGAVQDYSSRGPTPGGKKRPHLVAPGGSLATGILSCTTNGQFGDCGMGTSYAAPHVAGLLALLLQAQPNLTPDQQRNFLLGNCKKFIPNHANIHGDGLLVF
jgi:serine protease AprX